MKVTHILQNVPIGVTYGIDDVLVEILRQDELWGENRIQNAFVWNAILTEEVGEVAKEVLERNQGKLRAELIQVAAAAINWIKALDRNEVPDE